MDKRSLSVCSYNCRSIKNSLPAVARLCDSYDIVLLQEHWLLSSELDMLQSVHSDFYAYGLSAVDCSSDVLVGRPYGGTAVLYRKELAEVTQHVASDESRITGIQVLTDIGPVLIMNVYMPTNYGDDNSLELYMDCLGKLHATVVDNEAAHVLIVGDFNCSPGSRFFNDFIDFADDNNFIVSDLRRLTDVVTYISDDGKKMSWIDHVLCTASVDSIISHMSILDDVICSDHKPLYFSLECSVAANDCFTEHPVHSVRWIPNWQQCDDLTLFYYAQRVDELLQQVDIPFDLLSNQALHDGQYAAIDKFYNDFLHCINTAVGDFIPMCKKSGSDYNIAGWNTYVKDKHDVARDAYLSWIYDGKPKQGYTFEIMKKTRATFKLAFRYCKRHEEQMRADACALSLDDPDPRKFWKNVYKSSNKKAVNLVFSVGGASGTVNVTSMWKSHFEKLYNTNKASIFRDLFASKLVNANLDNMAPCFSLSDITSALNRQKLGKSAGPDGLHMEAFLSGGSRLHVLLCVLFNLFIKFGYVPPEFHSAVIVPLVKCKTGDITDVNNYRAIAISNAITKILEDLLFNLVTSTDGIDDYQFGFKKGHSTGLCTQVFKRTVSYYRERGSHVFCCFVDFQKAFDNVDYWHLFCKLFDQNDSDACRATTRLLAYWYSHQQLCVRWHNMHSDHFYMSNGVRQGGLLSPFLFRFYIRDLIRAVVHSNTGCCISGCFINILAYADDLVLLSPSYQGMQTLLSILEKAASAISMSMNLNKTVCMVFNPLNKHKVVSDLFPPLKISSCNLSYVSQFKYLGHMIDNKLCDDVDINRELKCLFSRTNLLIRRFARCSKQVKLRLFRTYCLCFYDIGLWTNYHCYSFNKFASGYIKCMKLFFGFDKFSSVSSMLLELGLPSCSTVMHNAKFTFVNRLSSCSNKLVHATICILSV